MSVKELQIRLDNYIASMAPHQKQREDGKLLIESHDAISRLMKAMVEISTESPVGSAANTMSWEFIEGKS